MTAWYAQYMMDLDRQTRGVNRPMVDTAPGTRSPFEEVPIRRRKQVARTITFQPDMIEYINWQNIGDTRRSLACDLAATMNEDGSLTVQLFWPWEE